MITFLYVYDTLSLGAYYLHKWLIVTGIMAHSKTELWLTRTGQVAHLGTDYSTEKSNYSDIRCNYTRSRNKKAFPIDCYTEYWV